MKHTKGDWISRIGINENLIYSDSSGAICIIPHKNKEVEEHNANAKLIAAAPELLESLKEIREWYEKNHEKYLGEYTPVCFSKGLSAIQKATP